jgi:fructosamine-3-kinase
MPILPRELLGDVGQAAGTDFDASQVLACAGGSISRCYRLTAGDSRSCFLKTNTAERAALFASEAQGLRALAQAGAVRVPGVIAAGRTGPLAWLLLEFLALGAKTDAGGAALGGQLAMLHRQTAPRFGFDADNHIGSTTQVNRWQGEWAAFYAEQRLGFQLELAMRAGYAQPLAARGAQLIDRLPALLDGHQPAPSLLHGDLWGGNWGVATDGVPVIYDPAVYYGDREADLAMTRLFGGFPAGFYASYEEAWPLPPGHQLRADIYNLYHVLNHLNLFGAGYLSQAMGLVDRLLAA